MGKIPEGIPDDKVKELLEVRFGHELVVVKFRGRLMYSKDDCSMISPLAFFDVEETSKSCFDDDNLCINLATPRTWVLTCMLK